MFLDCPACKASFYIEKEKLGQGFKKVRCGLCGHVWDTMSAGSQGRSVKTKTEKKTKPANRKERVAIVILSIGLVFSLSILTICWIYHSESLSEEIRKILFDNLIQT